MIGWNNVSEMTKFGMPGVFTHGNFDTWSPGYLMFIAALHNGISRLYETFGNGGADTVERDAASRRVRAHLVQAESAAAENASGRSATTTTTRRRACSSRCTTSPTTASCSSRNFYLKSKRSILKPKTEGPAAYVLPGDDPRPGAQAELLRVLQKQGVEISRATAPFTVTVPGQEAPPRPTTTTTDGRPGWAGRAAAAESGRASGAGWRRTGDGRRQDQANAAETPPPTTRTFPAGSYIVRMDQPYSRIADSLLDYQYWSPNDPQRTPYDDTGWTFPELFNVQAVRVADVEGARRADGEGQRRRRREGRPSTDTGIGLRRQPQRRHRARDAALPAEGRLVRRRRGAVRGRRARNSIAARSSSRTSQPADLQKAAADLGLQIVAAGSAPSVKTHPVRAPRVALLHTWMQHADRRLVAPGVRQRARAVHLHQHAAGREGRQPQREVRRHRLSAGRPRHRRRSSTACRCTATRCRGRRRPRRRTSARRIRPTTCVRASAGSASRTCRTSSAKAACCSR